VGLDVQISDLGGSACGAFPRYRSAMFTLNLRFFGEFSGKEYAA